MSLLLDDDEMMLCGRDVKKLRNHAFGLCASPSIHQCVETTKWPNEIGIRVFCALFCLLLE
jgi:hypothetical protein